MAESLQSLKFEHLFPRVAKPFSEAGGHSSWQPSLYCNMEHPPYLGPAVKKSWLCTPAQTHHFAIIIAKLQMQIQVPDTFCSINPQLDLRLQITRVQLLITQQQHEV